MLLVIGAVYFFFQEAPRGEQQQPNTPFVEKKIDGYVGTVLAGKSAPYLTFQQADYEKAVKGGKIIFLDFYANWCPVCRAEAPEIQGGFQDLETDKVVGFRVNYNDSETDDQEKQLAKEFGVTYQHTKLFLKDGKVLGKSLEQWDKETFLQEIETILANN